MSKLELAHRVLEQVSNILDSEGGISLGSTKAHINSEISEGKRKESMSLPSSNAMPRAYNPNEVEEPLYQFWMDKGYFTPKIDHSKKPFVVIMPLPNVTGDLHSGTCALTMFDTGHPYCGGIE